MLGLLNEVMQLLKPNVQQTAISSLPHLTTRILLEWSECTCEDSVLLAGLTPADFEWGVQDLSETQVTHSTGGWIGTKKDNEQGQCANEMLSVLWKFIANQLADWKQIADILIVFTTSNLQKKEKKVIVDKTVWWQAEEN